MSAKNRKKKKKNLKIISAQLNIIGQTLQTSIYILSICFSLSARLHLKRRSTSICSLIVNNDSLNCSVLRALDRYELK